MPSLLLLFSGLETEMKLHHIASSLPHAANLWLQKLSMQHCIASSLKINQDRARLVSSNRDWFAYHTNIPHSLYVYVEETIMPPLVLPSGPKPCGGKKRNRFHASGSHDNVIHRLTAYILQWGTPIYFVRNNFSLRFSQCHPIWRKHSRDKTFQTFLSWRRSVYLW